LPDMKHLLILLMVCSAVACHDATGPDLHPVDERLKTMSLEQKVGQMAQVNVELFLQKKDGQILVPLRLDTAKLEEAIARYHVGSIMNCGGFAHSPEEWRYLTHTIQALGQKHGEVPILYAFDAVHGANYVQGSTLFPHQLALAATWNDSLVCAAAGIAARECRSVGVPWIFSPILDLARQPVWGQFFQTFGEDPYLTQSMGTAVLNGYESAKVLACGKHFTGYGQPSSGKDRSPVLIGERTVRELHLPPFQAAIAAGLPSIMVGTNELDGVPMLASYYWLTEVLRDEMGFEGVLLSDWADIAHLVSWHHVAHDEREATRMALDAGLDMAMVPNDYGFIEHTLALVHEGSISEERIDASVRRILMMKDVAGLFEEWVHSEVEVGSLAHKDVAYEAAIECITLLKNKGDVLPLQPNQRVLLTGFGADDMRMYAGAWSRTWQGHDSLITHEGHLTLRAAMAAMGVPFSFSNACSYDRLEDLEATTQAAKACDVVVAVMGEWPATEKPSDIGDLSLPTAQKQYLMELAGLGKPVVLVLLEDRPRVLSDVIPELEAVVMAYRPGVEGGRALADLLYGKRNFSGKLPFTYPSAVNDLLHYDHKHIEDIGPDWGNTGFSPQWPFGFGLSYTSFSYSDLRLDQEAYELGDTVVVTVNVHNTGQRTGSEVVQVYGSDEVASVSPPVARLRKYVKVQLAPGETRQVRLSLPIASFEFVGIDLQSSVEPGWFTLRVGGLTQRFEVHSP
jgi:beta-glucosidase